jgi:DNA-binding NarL/FixJ family response regulator
VRCAHGSGRVPAQGHPPAEIVNAVRLVATGDALLSASVTRTLLGTDHDSPFHQKGLKSDRHPQPRQR